MPPRCGRRGRREPRRPSGRRNATSSSLGLRTLGRARSSRDPTRAQFRGGCGRRDRRLSRVTSTCAAASGSPASARSCSTRSSRSRTRWSATAASCRQRRCAHARCARSTDALSRRRSRRRRYSSPRCVLRGRFDLPARATGGLLRRRRGPPVSTRRALGRRVHRAFVGKLIPLHGVETILGAAALCPRSRSASSEADSSTTLLAATPGERAITSRGWSTSGFPICTAPRVARSDLRHVSEGRTRHPEQGLSGARDRNAADHRGHTSRAGAPRGRARRTPRASREPGSAGARRYAGSRRSPALSSSIGARGTDDIRGECVRGRARRTWRVLLERLIP